jgi:hypothetical protein
MAFTGMMFGKTSSSVTLTSSLNPSTYGSSVTFTATVTPTTATGTVTFKNGSTTLGTGTISSGIATYSTTTLPAGSDSINDLRYMVNGNDVFDFSPSTVMKRLRE